MNWTGGQLSRHSKAAQKPLTQIQKEHFAKVRRSVRHGHFISSPTKSRPEVRDVRTACSLKTVSSTRQSGLNDSHGHVVEAGLESTSRSGISSEASHTVHRDRPDEASGCFDMSSERFGLHQLPTLPLKSGKSDRRKRNIRDIRSELLSQNDWAGTKSRSLGHATPMEFPVMEDKEKIAKRRRIHRTGQNSRIPIHSKEHTPPTFYQSATKSYENPEGPGILMQRSMRRSTPNPRLSIGRPSQCSSETMLLDLEEPLYDEEDERPQHPLAHEDSAPFSRATNPSDRPVLEHGNDYYESGPRVTGDMYHQYSDRLTSPTSSRISAGRNELHAVKHRVGSPHRGSIIESESSNLRLSTMVEVHQSPEVLPEHVEELPFTVSDSARSPETNSTGHDVAGIPDLERDPQGASDESTWRNFLSLDHESIQDSDEALEIRRGSDVLHANDHEGTPAVASIVDAAVRPDNLDQQSREIRGKVSPRSGVDRPAREELVPPVRCTSTTSNAFRADANSSRDDTSVADASHTAHGTDAAWMKFVFGSDDLFINN